VRLIINLLPPRTALNSPLIASVPRALCSARGALCVCSDAVVCPYARVNDALREATDDAVIVVKGGRYAEHAQLPQVVRVTANNITLQYVLLIGAVD